MAWRAEFLVCYLYSYKSPPFFFRLIQICNIWESRTTHAQTNTCCLCLRHRTLTGKWKKKKRFSRNDSCDSADGTLPSKWLKSGLLLTRENVLLEMIYFRLLRRTWIFVTTEDPSVLLSKGRDMYIMSWMCYGATALSPYNPLWTSSGSYLPGLKTTVLPSSYLHMSWLPGILMWVHVYVTQCVCICTQNLSF